MALFLQSLLFKPHSFPFYHRKCRTPLVQSLIDTSPIKRCDLSTCLASSRESDSISYPVALPIYPSTRVLFPGAKLNLQISEVRYRIMMNTVLQTDLRFGVVFSDPVPYGTEQYSRQVGCVAEVVKHQILADDRFLITCKGLERFCILNIQRTKPYKVTTVTQFEDWPLYPTVVPIMEKLGLKVEGHLKDVTRLVERLEGKNQNDQNIDDVDLRKGQSLTTFSFFVASCLQVSQKEKQELLEMMDTALRLAAEREMLMTTVNYLYAALAVKDAFSSSP